MAYKNFIAQGKMKGKALKNNMQKALQAESQNVKLS